MDEYDKDELIVYTKRLRSELQYILFDFLLQKGIFTNIPKLNIFLSEDGYTLDKYTISSTILGEGRFGRVLECGLKNPANTDKYAVKIIQKNKIIQLKQLHKLDNELRILSKLDSKYTIRFMEAYHTNRFIWLVTEYGGASLYKFWKNKKEKFSLTDIKFVILNVLNGLDYLHKKGVSHRDLKMDNLLIIKDRNSHSSINSSIKLPHISNLSSENISKSSNNLEIMGDEECGIILEESVIKICDFGFSIDSENVDRSGMVGDFCGTPGFFAPELINNSTFNACKTDLWSIGCILLELFIGEHLFLEYWVKQCYRKEYFNDNILFGIEMVKGVERINQYLEDIFIRKFCKNITNNSESPFKRCSDFLFDLLQIEPEKRINTNRALVSFFCTEIPCCMTPENISCRINKLTQSIKLDELSQRMMSTETVDKCSIFNMLPKKPEEPPKKEGNSRTNLLIRRNI